MLHDNGKELKLPKIHGNKKIRNLITGQRTMTHSQWRRLAKESSQRLIKAFREE